MTRFLRGGLLAIALVAGSLPRLAAQELIFGITAVDSQSISDGINLVSFNSTTPGTFLSSVALSGTIAGHGVRSIDFNRLDGNIYALSTSGTTPSEGQIYTVNRTTGALTTVGSTFTLAGSTLRSAEMDFIPGTNEVRVISRSGQNARVNALTGALVQAGTNVAYVAGDPQAGNAPDFAAIAHRNDGTLFAWDYQSDAHVRVGGVAGSPSADNGESTTVFAPAAFLTSSAGIGMDVSPFSNTLYVTHDDPSNVNIMRLYTRDMATGAETVIGAYTAGTFVVDVTVVPEPTTVLAGIAGLFGLGYRLRRKV